MKVSLLVIILVLAIGFLAYRHHAEREALKAELAAAQAKAAQQEERVVTIKEQTRKDWMWDKTRENPLDKSGRR